MKNYKNEYKMPKQARVRKTGGHVEIETSSKVSGTAIETRNKSKSPMVTMTRETRAPDQHGREEIEMTVATQALGVIRTIETMTRRGQNEIGVGRETGGNVRITDMTMAIGKSTVTVTVMIGTSPRLLIEVIEIVIMITTDVVGETETNMGM
jgi:hypothetical protein